MSSHLPGHPFAFVATMMASFPRPWFLCGGWAADAWLGRKTRDHGDIDIAVFHEDQRAIFEHLAGWHIVADDVEPDVPLDRRPWDGHILDPDHRWTWPKTPAHLHVRPPGNANLAALEAWTNPPYIAPADDRNVEVMFIERSGPDWLINPNPRIARPLHLCIRQSAAGIPTAAPEVLIFFKATAYWGQHGGRYPRATDEADAQALLPLLGTGERDWLRDAISVLIPGHPWLEALAI